MRIHANYVSDYNLKMKVTTIINNMKNKVPLCCFTLLSVSSSLLAAGSNGEINNKKPNILILLTDDQSYNTIHALGNEAVVTPNMDQLVHDGTSFMQTHVMGALSGAVSMPSRAMLLTGRYLHNIHQDGRVIPEEDKTFPEIFRENGYVTFATGKWHSDKASFNRSFSTGANIFLGGMHPYNTDGHFKPLLHDYDPTGKYDKGGYKNKFSSECYADAAVDFISNRKDRDKPYLMYVAFTSPHDPRTPPPTYGHKYKGEELSLPLNFLLEHPFDNGDLKERDEVLLSVPRDPDAVKNEMALYYGMVSEVDTQIGRIIEALKKKGEYNNTIIVFTSDNGLAVGQHGLLGKQNLYEHSVKVPMIIIGPNVPQDVRNNTYCYLLDIFPTLCEFTGIKVPESVDGTSFVTPMKDKTAKGREHVYLSYINLQRAIKKDDYKLILYNVNGERRVQLFDLKNDPWERDNLAGAPMYYDKVKELTQLLEKEMIAKNDFCDPLKLDWGYPRKLTWDEVMQINP